MVKSVQFGGVAAYPLKPETAKKFSNEPFVSADPAGQYTAFVDDDKLHVSFDGPNEAIPQVDGLLSARAAMALHALSGLSGLEQAGEGAPEGDHFQSSQGDSPEEGPVPAGVDPADLEEKKAIFEDAWGQIKQILKNKAVDVTQASGGNKDEEYNPNLYA